MPKKTTQDSNYKFIVRMEPNALANTRNTDGSPILTGGYSVVRTDINRVLGTVSEHYGIVQNTDLLDAARSAFAKRGLLALADEKITVVDGGKRMYATFTFRTGQLTADRAVGDVLGYKVILRNSFDRTQTASFQLGFERLTCKNGMVGMMAEFSCDKKHHKKLTLDFLPDALDKAINSGSEGVGLFKELAAVDIDDEKGQRILHNMVKFNAFSGRLREKVENVWLNPPFEEDKGRNLYNLYNAITYVLTRQVEADRYERAQELNFNALNLLQRAARGKDSLEKLLLPIDDEKKISVVITQPAAVIVAP